MPQFEDPIAYILGAVDVGVLLCTMLYGMTTIQTYIYAMGPKRDKPLFRALILSIWCLETTHMGAAIAYFWDINITHYSDISSSLSLSPASFNIALGINAIIASIVQAFFNYRIYIVSGKIWLAIPGWILAATHPAVFIVVASGIWKDGGWGFFKKSSWTMIFAFLVVLALDFWTSVVLIWVLRSKRGGYRQTDQMINRAIVWTLETGVLACASAAVGITSYLTEYVGIAAAVLLFYGGLYSNCLLVSLNTRMSNHEDGGGWSRHQEPPPVLIGLRTRPEQVAVAAITERSEEGFIKTSAV